MKRFFTTTLLTAGVAFAWHLIDTKQTPADFVKNTTKFVQDKQAAAGVFQEKQAAFKSALDRFQTELDRTQPVIDDIKKDVDQFQFKIQPHLDIISQHTDRFTSDDADN